MLVEAEPVAAPEHPEVVVERVVLHHHDDDVLDLRQDVGPLGQLRVRQRAGAEGRAGCPERAHQWRAQEPRAEHAAGSDEPGGA